MVAGVEGRSAGPDGGQISADAAPQLLADRWRRGESHLYLNAQGPKDPDARFYFSGLQAYETQVVLHSLDIANVAARVKCDAEIRLLGVGDGPVSLAPNRTGVFTLRAAQAGRARLSLGPEVQECELRWGAGHKVKILREETALPNLARLDARQDTCAAPDPVRLDPLEKVFYADRWMSQSCAQPAGSVSFLPGQLEALNARVEALTGRKASGARLRAGNPDMALDYTHAPKLDVIYLSYLLVRADFSGYLTARMLAWHASRGTVVRILVTDRLMLSQDRALFENLAAQYPNVQIQYFVWEKPGVKTPAEMIDVLQRSQHIKVFATLSPQSGRSRFIVGGRNIFDGFFFDRPVDLRAYPALRTYDETALQGLTYYSIYKDFEIVMRDDAVVKTVAAQLSTFWHRDMRTQVARPMAVNGPETGRATGGVRHFMSLPWADGLAQETYFTELFDAAQKEIVIVTPFMYPTAPIMDAMLRAHARGVKITVVARINSTDPSGTFITALNRGFAQRRAGDFAVYEYVPGQRMMHTKLILIDKRLSIVTSTNMNHRSFLHDTENGVVFLDRAMTARLRAVVDDYLTTAIRIQPGGQLRPFDRMMNRLTGLWQYF